MPEDGWLLSLSGDGPFKAIKDYLGGVCGNQWEGGPPEPFVGVGASDSLCVESYDPLIYNPMSGWFWYVPASAIHPTSTLKDYDPGTDTPDIPSRYAPDAPDSDTGRSALGDTLDGPDAGLLREWLDYEMDPDPDPSENPLETGIPPQIPRDKRCEISTPAPDSDTTTDRWAVHTTFQRKTLDGNMVDTYLYWGVATAPSEKPWKGFGYRKIAAKHGWQQADATATAQALQRTPERNDLDRGDHSLTRWQYTGPVYDPPAGGPGKCRRRVVVQTDVAGAEPQAREIITSYGHWASS
ncbi:MAG TPA: hypothetical protein VF257_15370 [Solirubrobacteraceae bacterium]